METTKTVKNKDDIRSIVSDDYIVSSLDGHLKLNVLRFINFDVYALRHEATEGQGPNTDYYRVSYQVFEDILGFPPEDLPELFLVNLYDMDSGDDFDIYGFMSKQMRMGEIFYVFHGGISPYFAERPILYLDLKVTDEYVYMTYEVRSV